MFFYQRVPIVFGQEVGHLLREVRSNLARVNAPVLIMQGLCDRTIPADSAQILFNGLGTTDKEIVWWPNSGHAITVDSERQAVWARAYAFMAAHARERRGLSSYQFPALLAALPAYPPVCPSAPQILVSLSPVSSHRTYDDCPYDFVCVERWTGAVDLTIRPVQSQHR